MIERRVSWIWPAMGAGLAIGLGMAHWAFGLPGGWDGLPFGAFILAAAWLRVEWARSRRESDHAEENAIHNMSRVLFAVVGLYVAVFSGLSLVADGAAADGSWEPMAQRVMGVVGGLMLATWGNHLPKLLSPWPLEDEPFDWQRIHRAVGWLAALGGLVVAVSWVALPVSSAATVSVVVVAGVFVSAVGMKVVSVATHSPAGGR